MPGPATTDLARLSRRPYECTALKDTSVQNAAKLQNRLHRRVLPYASLQVIN